MLQGHNYIVCSCSKYDYRRIGFYFISSNVAHSVLEIIHSEDILIANSTFQGRRDLSVSMSRAILARHSIILVANCLFESNTGDNGGAISADESTITLRGNTFSKNRALKWCYI